MEVATSGRTEFENSQQSRKKLNDLTSDRSSTSPFQRVDHHPPGNYSLRLAVENLFKVVFICRQEFADTIVFSTVSFSL